MEVSMSLNQCFRRGLPLQTYWKGHERENEVIKRDMYFCSALLLSLNKVTPEVSIAEKLWPNLHELNRVGVEERAGTCSLPGNGGWWKAKCETADRDLGLWAYVKEEREG